MTLRNRLLLFGCSTLIGIIGAAIVLMAINASLYRFPAQETLRNAPMLHQGSSSSVDVDYGIITDRNLFRAQLKAEIPRTKTPKELETETLTALAKAMSVKGIMLGQQRKDCYSVIDRGGQKGVWTYKVGDVIEHGLAVTDITRNSVKLQKGDFTTLLRLFAAVQEQIAGGESATPKGRGKNELVQSASAKGENDYTKQIKREGSTTVLSKSLANELKANKNLIMSSLTVKAAGDGFKVVSVDQGSLARALGISANDTLLEVNGYRLTSSDDIEKAYEGLKNATRFEIKVLRKGKQEGLKYEIR